MKEAKTKKKIAAVLIFCALFITMPTKKADASFWGFADVGTQALTFVVEELTTIVKELAGAAQEIITTQSVTTYILGTLSSGSSSTFIQDYNEFLFEQPTKQAETYAEAFLTEVLHGREPGDYGYGDGVDGLLGHYESRLRLAAAEGIVTGARSGAAKDVGVDIADYCTMREGKLLLFGEATKSSFTCFSGVFANPYNHPVGIKAATRTAFDGAVQQEQTEKEIKALTAEGVLPDEDKFGITTRPALDKLNDLKAYKTKVYDKLVDKEWDHPVAQVIYTAAMPALLKATDKAIEREVNRSKRRANEKIQEIRKNASKTTNVR